MTGQNLAAADGDWAALPYAAGWGAAGAPYLAGRYMKDQHGFVHVEGAAVSTTTYTYAVVVATLPTGFRPSASHRFPMLLSDGTNNFAAIVTVASNGTVTLAGNTTTNVNNGGASGDILWFGTLIFKAEG